VGEGRREKTCCGKKTEEERKHAESNNNDMYNSDFLSFSQSLMAAILTDKKRKEKVRKIVE
jgi:hypothetical protein